MYGLDLFSGIGGLTKALEGYVEPVAYCESDRYCQGVLLSRMDSGHLPCSPIWDDIRTLQGIQLPMAPNIIYGGFPCQDISVAGRGGGLEGERSGLFFEVTRLISEIRPRFVFLENVAAITVRGSERVVGELCRLGYDCRWGLLSASDVGANHRRERWWLLAHARHGSGRDVGTSETWQDTPQERSGDHYAPSGPGEQSSDVAHADWNTTGRLSIGEETKDAASGEPGKMADSKCDGWEKSRNRRISRGKANSITDPGWWESEPNVGRVAHGVPFRVDRLRGLGNAVVPAQAREAFERLIGIKKT